MKTIRNNRKFVELTVSFTRWKRVELDDVLTAIMSVPGVIEDSVHVEKKKKEAKKD